MRCFFLRFCLSLFGTLNAYTLQTVVRSIHRMTDSVRTDDDDDDYSKFHWPLHTRFVVSFSFRITPLSFVFIRWTFNFTVQSLLSRCQWRREETNWMHSAGVMEWSRWLRSKVNKVTGRFDADEKTHFFFSYSQVEAYARRCDKSWRSAVVRRFIDLTELPNRLTLISCLFSVRQRYVFVVYDFDDGDNGTGKEPGDWLDGALR